MILGVLIVNTSGLTRFAKFYEFVSAACQQDIQRIVYEQLSSREDTKTCNFATPQPPSSDSRLSRVATQLGAYIDLLQSVQRTSASIPSPLSLSSSSSSSSSNEQVSPGMSLLLNADNDPDDAYRIIYQRFASLYFVVLANQSESLLGILDIIRVFVMALEDCFPNVCELDIAYNPDKVAMVLAQIVSGGMVIETNLSRIHPLT